MSEIRIGCGLGPCVHGGDFSVLDITADPAVVLVYKCTLCALTGGRCAVLGAVNSLCGRTYDVARATWVGCPGQRVRINEAIRRRRIYLGYRAQLEITDRGSRNVPARVR